MRVEDALRYLRESAVHDRVSQAYLVTGNPAEEGAAVAEGLLAMLFCSAGADGVCGTCAGCRRVRERTHPDVLWVEPQLKSRAISIEQVRTLQERVYRTAFEGGWKACVLAGADCMQDPAANAFLKTLEEPPPRTVFLLLTDSPQRLLPTIISRCQVLEVSAREGGVGGETEALVLGILADEAGGTMAGARMRAEKFRGLLKALKDTATAEAREEAKAERGALGEGTEGGGPDAATVDARAGARYREARMRVMRTVLLWYRDILVRVCGGAAEMLYYQSHRDMIEGLARKTSYRAARGRVVAVTEMYDRMERNVPEKAVLHAAFVKLAAPE